MVLRTLHLSLTGATLLAVLSMSSFAYAQVRQSSSYRIQSDSINIGGELSSSGSYILEDTTGEIASGESSSASYSLKAGYQQMQQVYLALTGAANVVMSPALGGVTGGESNGSVTLTAITDGPSGYELQIRASSSPALVKGADTIDDYTPAGLVPDFTFSTGATEAHFGFSPEGDDIASRYNDDGAACGVDTGDTALRCWDGLSTTDTTIATRSSANHPTGTDTTIRFRVGIGASVNQPVGTYVATTTVTLLSL